jgi:hypothetical protein
MLDWIKKPEPGHEDPMRTPASASAMLAELRKSDPVTALSELRGWLGSLGNASDVDERARSEVLGLIQEAGAAHALELLRQYLATAPDNQVLRESKWKATHAYAANLAEVLCKSADRLQAVAKADASALGAAAAGAVRGLRACRMLAKICLIHYMDVPSSLWRRAYALHAAAEAAGCADTAVHPHRSQRISTTATHELLRLVMVQVTAPETLASEQIEIVDRVAEHIGADFTLRPPGVADNPFCFAPEGDRPPQRATPDLQAGARFFGPGVGFDALTRLHRQMATANGQEASALGRDIPSHVQVAAVEHLLRHWGPNAPRASPAHSPAKGELLVVHGFAAVCRHLSGGDAKAGEPRGLELASEEDTQPAPPEAWTIRDAGGNEVGAEMPQPGANWARSGMLVAFCVAGRSEWWVGVIRRTHADIGKDAHIDIALVSRNPVGVSLRPQARGSPGGADWDASAGTFAFVNVSAILLPDASQAAGTPHLLLPPESWQEGRVYESMLAEGPRDLRLVRALQRGEDFVRAAFEWLPAGDGDSCAPALEPIS